MSVTRARGKRTALYLSVTGLLFMVAAISAISARDPDGLSVRIGMVLIVVGAAMWLPWQALLPVTIATWLAPNLGRNLVEGYELFGTNMMLELPGLLGLAAVSAIARISLRSLEQEHVLLGMQGGSLHGLDPDTGVFDEGHLRNSIEAELARSRRFGRSFALVLVGIDQLRQRFDYRDERAWQASFAATASLLRGTRANVDRVYRYGRVGFALILPESGPKEVNGLVRRLRRVARNAHPAEGEPGGPLPAHFGATFFPSCATTVEDMLRRAEVALRIAESNGSRVQIDGAEAPEMPPAETLRQQYSPQDGEDDGPPEQDAEPAVPTPEAQTEAALRDEQPAPILRLVEAPTTGIDPSDRAETYAPTSAPSQDLPTRQEVAPSPPAFETSPPPPLYALEDAIETDEEPPIEAYAIQAPEPPVDVYGEAWQAEAPLSVIRRPRARQHLAALPAGDTEGSGDSLHREADDAKSVAAVLAQLDETLEVIRSIRRRCA